MNPDIHFWTFVKLYFTFNLLHQKVRLTCHLIYHLIRRATKKN
jgi:hypothetical protein